MANVSAQDRGNIMKLVVGMFNAAPGAGYLQEFSDAFLAMNSDYSALALALGNTAPFKSLYPANMTATAFTNKFLGTLGLQSSTDAQYWVKAQLAAKKPYAQVMLEALVAIVETDDPAYANAKKLLENKASVAEYFSYTQKQSSESMDRLQSVFKTVTAKTNVSTAAAKEAVIQAGLGYKMELDGAYPINLQGLKSGDTFVIGAYSYLKADWVNGGKSIQFAAASGQTKASLNLIVKDTNDTSIYQNLGFSGFKTLNIKLDTSESGADYFSLSAMFTNLGTLSLENYSKGTSYKTAADVPANHWTKMVMDTVVLTGGSGLVKGKVKEEFKLEVAPVVDVVDATGFKAQLTLELNVGLTTIVGSSKYFTGDNLVKVGEYGIRGMLYTQQESVTTFQFTKDAVADVDTVGDALAWKIYNFAGIKENSITAKNKTVLDLSMLGIHSVAELSMERLNGDVVIHGENGQNFKIVLVGQKLEDLGVENFVFG